MPGVFTISLDFELHWGVFDKKNRDAQKICYVNTIQVIPRMLKLFNEFEVHASWAVVGGLFARNEAEWKSLMPDRLPDYHNPAYSAYRWAEKNGLGKAFSWAHFAPDTVRSILDYPGQELATHTFGHYYCLEPQEKPAKAFAADLDAAIRAASDLNQSFISLVFPRNQFNEEFLRISYKKGIQIIRCNPQNWFWTPVSEEKTSLARKVFRTGDAYLPIGSSSYPLSAIATSPDIPLQLPASRLFRSWLPGKAILNQLRLRRIIRELKTAAKNGACYHLWWHPENFGNHPDQNLADLQIILEEYRECRQRYGMESWNMGEYVGKLRPPKT